MVYWFQLVRTKDGVDWIPYRAADDTGIGRQVTVADINGDKLPDMIVGGMKGANVSDSRAAERESPTSGRRRSRRCFAAGDGEGGGEVAQLTARFGWQRRSMDDCESVCATKSRTPAAAIDARNSSESSATMCDRSGDADSIRRWTRSVRSLRHFFSRSPCHRRYRDFGQSPMRG